MKHAISITLGRDNLMWLKGQAAARTGGNVSEMMNRLIEAARTSGGLTADARTVVGTIDLPDDESLAQADTYVKALFDRSLSRPMLVRERPPKRPGRRG
jgi:hypothetical protein